VMDGFSFICKQLRTNWTGITHQYTVLQETEKTCQILNRTKSKCGVFKKMMEQAVFFCGNNTLTEGVFVTQPSSNAGNSVGRIVGYDRSSFHALCNWIMEGQNNWESNLHNKKLRSDVTVI